MKNTFFAFLVAALLLPVSVFAKGPLTAPTLVNGQYVYTIPADFDPPLVKRAGLEELNNVVKSLHFPYYIVIIQDLPGNGGDASDRTNAATDGLAADWTEAGGFDPSVSQVITLFYYPRKLGLLVGAKFKSELRFEGSAHRPYLEIFERSVKGTPKDPKGGIKAMIKGIDDYLFDQTDSTLVAGRKEAARVLEAKRVEDEKIKAVARLMQEARDGLNGEIGRLQAALDEKQDLPVDTSSFQELLDKAMLVRKHDDTASMPSLSAMMAPIVGALVKTVTSHHNARRILEGEIARMTTIFDLGKENLPKDVSSYRSMLSKAKEVLAASQTESMNEAYASLKASADKLKSEILVIEIKRDHDARTSGLLWTLFIMSFLGLLLVYLIKRTAFIRLQRFWKDACIEKEDHIANAMARYVDFYTERDKCARLANATGKTGALYASVTASVDEMFAMVQAMGTNLGKYKLIASQATIFNTKPLLQALHEIDWAFKFDTGQLNPVDLFGSQTKVIQINPGVIMKVLQSEFEGTIEGWKKLKEASDVLYTTVREVFSHQKLDALFALVRENKIPERWLQSHPLFGDDASDDTFWEELTTLRNSDPIAFLERVKEEQEAELDLEAGIHGLICAVERVRSNRMEQLLDVDGIVCDPDDDPSITFQSARHEEDLFAGLLASGEDVHEIQMQAEKIIVLFKKCAKQTATLASSKQSADELLIRVHTARSTLNELTKSAHRRVLDAKNVHSNTESAKASLKAGDEFFAEADRVLEKAMRQKEEKRFLNARITVEKALAAFDKVSDAYKKAISSCNDLDTKKKTFESRLTQMDASRREAEQKIVGYGRSATLTYHAPMFDASSALDYIVLQRQLDEQQAVWDQQARDAQRVYEDEQERQRQIRAAEALRIREAQEAIAAAERAERRQAQAIQEAADEEARAQRRQDQAEEESRQRADEPQSNNDSSASNVSWSDNSSTSSSSNTDW